MYIYFIRHGESSTNKLHIIYNRGSLHGLTQKGRQQMFQLSKELKSLKFDKIISSPLLRAIESSNILAGELNLKIELSESLREYDVGLYDNTGSTETFDRDTEILKEWLINKNWDISFEQGESYKNIADRFMKLMNPIEKETDLNYIFMSHGGLIQCMLPYLCKNISYEYSFDKFLNNGEYSIIQYVNNEFLCLKHGKNDLNS